jgi:hypothetical protein
MQKFEEGNFEYTCRFKEKPGMLSCTARLLLVIAGLVAYSATAFFLIPRDDPYSDGFFSSIASDRNATFGVVGTRSVVSLAVRQSSPSEFLHR